jgi:hypothetical protein
MFSSARAGHLNGAFFMAKFQITKFLENTDIGGIQEETSDIITASSLNIGYVDIGDDTLEFYDDVAITYYEPMTFWIGFGYDRNICSLRLTRNEAIMLKEKLQYLINRSLSEHL